MAATHRAPVGQRGRAADRVRAGRPAPVKAGASRGRPALWLALGGIVGLAVLLAAMVLALRAGSPPAAPQAAPDAPSPGAPAAQAPQAPQAPPNVLGRMEAPVEIEEWGDFQ